MIVALIVDERNSPIPPTGSVVSEEPLLCIAVELMIKMLLVFRSTNPLEQLKGSVEKGDLLLVEFCGTAFKNLVQWKKGRS